MNGSGDNGKYFGNELLAWYDVQKRDLPWRRSKDPYHIWVSEIMLQQTRVETVIPYYERFMNKFPTIEALAEAPEDEVLKAWEGLGYYSRARNLQAAVREVSEAYGGKVPADTSEIASLRGVGPYTAGAILSIAYNLPEPAVDGNVMRVLSRFFLIQDDVTKPATRAKMEKLARELIPDGKAGDFNQAIMELGALVCTPRNPQCLTCPVMERCAGRIGGKETSLPVKTKAKAPRKEYRVTALIEGTGKERGKVLIRRRPSEGLLAGMWELPHVLLPGNADSKDIAGSQDDAGRLLCERLSEQLESEIILLERLPDIDHVFSHIHWNMLVYRCRLAEHYAASAADTWEYPYNEYAWIGPEDRVSYTFPNVFNRLLDAWWQPAT